MLSRRGFLIGAGGLLTAAFVKDAGAFFRQTKQPLLATPPQVAETLCWYDNGDGLLLTLGDYVDCPPPPTWREFFTSKGIRHRTEQQVCRIWDNHGIGPEDYDEPVDEYYWETLFDTEFGPCAKAYRLLRRLDLGPALQSGSQAHLEFNKGDVGDEDRLWVSASDQLALSLLQARLIDLRLPIGIAKGK